MVKGTESRLLGGEGAAWTEMTATFRELEWKTWPRMCVVAEIFWRNEPVKDRKADAFMARLAAHRERLVARGVNAAPLGPLEPETVEVGQGVRVPWDGRTCVVLTETITAKTEGIATVLDASLKPGTFVLKSNWRSVEISHADAAALAKALALLNRIARPVSPGIKAIPTISGVF